MPKIGKCRQKLVQFIHNGSNISKMGSRWIKNFYKLVMSVQFDQNLTTLTKMIQIYPRLFDLTKIDLTWPKLVQLVGIGQTWICFVQFIQILSNWKIFCLVLWAFWSQETFFKHLKANSLLPQMKTIAHFGPTRPTLLIFSLFQGPPPLQKLLAHHAHKYSIRHSF